MTSEHAGSRDRPMQASELVEGEASLTPRESGMVDDRQEQLMTRDSVDGRPPARWLRFAEWRWVVIVGPLVLIALVVFAITQGVSAPALLLGGFLIVFFFLVAAWPAWGAGGLRGKGERAARKRAVVEVQALEKPTRPSS